MVLAVRARTSHGVGQRDVCGVPDISFRSIRWLIERGTLIVLTVFTQTCVAFQDKSFHFSGFFLLRVLGCCSSSWYLSAYFSGTTGHPGYSRSNYVQLREITYGELQIVKELCTEDEDVGEPEVTDRGLIIDSPEADPSLQECFYQSQLLVSLVTGLLPAVLLYAYQSMILPRAFYAIALFERVHKSLSGAPLHSDGKFGTQLKKITNKHSKVCLLCSNAPTGRCPLRLVLTRLSTDVPLYIRPQWPSFWFDRIILCFARFPD